MKLYDYNLTSINTSSTWYDDEPFILAMEAQQVFYLDDCKLGSPWKVVQKVQLKNVWDVPEVEDTSGVIDEDDVDPVTNDAYQQDEFNDVHWFVQEEGLEFPELHLNDFDTKIIASKVMDNEWMNDDREDNLINGDTEEEDDPKDGDEEPIISSDDEDSD